MERKEEFEKIQFLEPEGWRHPKVLVLKLIEFQVFWTRKIRGRIRTCLQKAPSPQTPNALVTCCLAAEKGGERGKNLEGEELFACSFSPSPTSPGPTNDLAGKILLNRRIRAIVIIDLLNTSPSPLVDNPSDSLGFKPPIHADAQADRQAMAAAIVQLSSLELFFRLGLKNPFPVFPLQKILSAPPGAEEGKCSKKNHGKRDGLKRGRKGVKLSFGMGSK